MIDLLKKLARLKEVSHRSTKILTNHIPRFLEEKSRLTIRARGFCVTNTEEGIFNIIIRDIS
jgi:hypothetical protein